MDHVLDLLLLGLVRRMAGLTGVHSGPISIDFRLLLLSPHDVPVGLHFLALKEPDRVGFVGHIFLVLHRLTEKSIWTWRRIRTAGLRLRARCRGFHRLQPA